MQVAVVVVDLQAVFVQQALEQIHILAQVEITLPLIKVYMAAVEQEIMRVLATMALPVQVVEAVAEVIQVLEVLVAQAEVEL
jgi:hypothetical protein